jgi:hypothetical protein
MQNAYFNVDKFDLTPAAQKALDADIVDIRARLAEDPHKKFRIRGHASDTGGLGHNGELSASRAKAIKDYMVKNGVPEDALITEADGITDQEVKTGHGVEEGRNRRGTITEEGPSTTPAAATTSVAATGGGPGTQTAAAGSKPPSLPPAPPPPSYSHTAQTVLTGASPSM